MIGTPLTKLLVVNSKVNRGSVKTRLIRSGIIKNNCYICGISEWLGKPLVLRLDHINGINNDYTVNNLRLLCPNCDSQTDTYCGRNLKKRAKKFYCCDCSKEVFHGSIRCRKHAALQQRTKINWQPIESIVKMLQLESLESVALKLGVSSTAVRKRLRRHGLPTSRNILWPSRR